MSKDTVSLRKLRHTCENVMNMANEGTKNFCSLRQNKFLMSQIRDTLLIALDCTKPENGTKEQEEKPTQL